MREAKPETRHIPAICCWGSCASSLIFVQCIFYSQPTLLPPWVLGLWSKIIGSQLFLVRLLMPHSDPLSQALSPQQVLTSDRLQLPFLRELPGSLTGNAFLLPPWQGVSCRWLMGTAGLVTCTEENTLVPFLFQNSLGLRRNCSSIHILA